MFLIEATNNSGTWPRSNEEIATIFYVHLRPGKNKSWIWNMMQCFVHHLYKTWFEALWCKKDMRFQPLFNKIWKSVGLILPNWMEKCSKPPTIYIYIHPYFEQKIRCEVYKVPNEFPSSTQSPLDFRVHLPSGWAMKNTPIPSNHTGWLGNNLFGLSAN